MGELVPAVPSSGLYLIIAALALVAIALLSQLKVPYVGEPHEGESTCPMGTIARNPAFIMALAAGAFGYAIMVLVMTATPMAMRAKDFEMDQVAFIM
ncbi:hypothetical protein [Nitrosomonas sp. ANs5]|uniref:hypothetical protein n=1 Tax=Nitrosomonas sp. ANs5 TaxID=3423941 RepID=UPI003D34DA12